MALTRSRLLVCALVGLGLLIYFWVLPYRPLDCRSDEVLGVDVSSHQGPVDWPEVAEAGIRFAYIKSTEGGDWVDDRFAVNWRAAGEAGLTRGAYHFFTLSRPGADQAGNFLRTAPPDALALPPAIDLEFGGNGSDRPAKESLLKELGLFLQPVEAAWGRPCLIYVSDDFEADYQVLEAFPRQRWVTGLQRPEPPWLIWQANQLGRIPGIVGQVDVDLMRP